MAGPPSETPTGAAVHRESFRALQSTDMTTARGVGGPTHVRIGPLDCCAAPVTSNSALMKYPDPGLPVRTISPFLSVPATLSWPPRSVMTEPGTPTQPVVEGATRAHPATMKDPVAAVSAAATRTRTPSTVSSLGCRRRPEPRSSSSPPSLQCAPVEDRPHDLALVEAGAPAGVLSGERSVR